MCLPGILKLKPRGSPFFGKAIFHGKQFVEQSTTIFPDYATQ